MMRASSAVLLFALGSRAKVDWPTTPIGACAPSCYDVESPECQQCCQNYDHETDWNCGTPEAAKCCDSWSAECFWVRSENNNFHGCKDCEVACPDDGIWVKTEGWWACCPHTRTKYETAYKTAECVPEGKFKFLHKSKCKFKGLEEIRTSEECEAAGTALGYTGYYNEVHSSSQYPEGCSTDGTETYFNTYMINGNYDGAYCGYIKDNRRFSCICTEPGGDGDSDGSGDAPNPADKVCIDVRKKKACKQLSYCDFDRDATPRCTDKIPGAKIPIKEFCEIIPTRGWCRKVDDCLWTGYKCMLLSEATCADIGKRRRCQFFGERDFCLHGKHCMWTKPNCSTDTDSSC